MNPTIQSGTHPDAESLTAFAEQLLSGAEREQVLAHMSVCGRCREVVFLSQQAAESEEPAEVIPQQDSHLSVAHRWFSGWRWAWVPVVALAGFVGVAIVQHTRRVATPPQQVAQITPETPPVRNATAAKSAESPAPAQAKASRQPSVNATMNELTAARKKDNQLADRDDRAFDEKKEEMAKQKDLKVGGMSGSFGVGQGVSGGSSHGMVAARAKAPSMGGPAALNQFQQQSQNQLAQNNALQASSNGAQSAQQASDALSLNAVREADKPSYSANKPAPTPPPGSVTETVNVQAQSVVPVQSAAAASPAPQISSEASLSSASNTKSFAKLKGGKLTLPGEAQALSVASAGRRTIAISTEGALFLSQDGGKNWQPVKTQWAGRALLVRTEHTGLHGTVSSLSERPLFELVTDKLETWSSPDGMTWTLQPPTVH